MHTYSFTNKLHIRNITDNKVTFKGSGEGKKESSLLAAFFFVLSGNSEFHTTSRVLGAFSLIFITR